MSVGVKKFWLTVAATVIATVTAACILGGIAWLHSVYGKIISLDKSASETVLILRQIQKDNENLIEDVKVNTNQVTIHRERIGENSRKVADLQRIIELLRGG